ncbi:MAG TPA: TonB-dependent receptor, partial [Xanthomonadales bacterium]|nr:TonB-dependent receptor [Xanthomonadales bacterium]
MSYGSFDQRDLVLSASTPLSENFRLGGSLAWFRRDGFGENLYLGLENYSKDSIGTRFSAEWDAGDAFSLRLNADYLDDESGARHGRRMLPGRLSGAPVLADVFNTRAGLVNPVPSVTSGGVALTAHWQPSTAWQVKNILAYREDETWATWDFDSLPSADFDLPQYFRNRQFSEELQLLMSADNWNGLLGFFLLDANAFQNYDVLLANTGAIIGLPGLNAFTEGDVGTQSWSLFFDFSWRFSEHWSVDLGARYTSDQRNSSVLRQTLVGGTSERFGGNPTLNATTSDFRGEANSSKLTPRLVINWTPNDDQLVYASYSEGFKGGGFDPRGQSSLAPDVDGSGQVEYEEVYQFMGFTPETVNALEWGLKSVLLQGRMNSRLALFWSDYTDVQIPGSLAVDSNGDGIDDQFVGTTTNAASADIKGAEWEGQAILAEDLGAANSFLRLGWAIGYLDAQFNEFIDEQGNDVADIYQFRNAPEWTISGLLSYELPLQLFSHEGS